MIRTISPDRNVALKQTQNWASYDHRTLYESVHVGNDPGQVGALAQEWAVLGRDIDDSARSMKECLVASEEGWQGVAAWSARRAIRQLADWSETVAYTADGLGKRVGEQGQIMAATKAVMPEPIEFDWHTTLTDGFAGGGLAGFAAALVDVKTKSDRASAAHQQAVAVMTDMEEQSRAVDTATPWFTLPPDPVAREVALSVHRDVVEHGEAPLSASEPKTRSVAVVPDGETTAGMPVGATPHPDAYQPGTTTPQVMVAQVTPPSTPHPGMPNLEAYKPVATAPLGALSAPAFTVPNSAGPRGVPSPDQYRPGGTSPQSLPGGPGGPGETTVRMPNVAAYEPGGRSRNPAGAPALPPPVPGMPRNNTSGGGGDSLRRGWGPQGPATLPPGGDPRTRTPAYTPPNAGPGGQGPAVPRPGVPGQAGTGQAMPRSGVPGQAGMAGGGMPGTAAGGARGEGAEDETHKSRYGNGERIFDAPGTDLPPSVIGGRTPQSEQD